MSPGVAILITVGLLVVSAFFVAAEFALVGARRHRLERAESEGRRGARAAVAGVRDLSMMLAGAQLGITMVVVGLGMVSEPALHHLLEPPLTAVGLPEQAADVVALIVALGIVTFVHVVVGEMAPKSWAIAHPERSAMLLAPAFRIFVRAVRWPLRLANGLTNTMLRLVGVTARDEIVTVRNREQLHHLVSESRRLNLIDDADHALLTRTLDAPARPVAEIMVPAAEFVTVDPAAGPQAVIDTAAASGRTRLVVSADQAGVVDIVHVREALIARRAGAAGVRWTAGAAGTPAPLVAVDGDVTAAVGTLRAARVQVGLVVDADGLAVGLVTMDDLMSTILVS